MLKQQHNPPHPGEVLWGLDMQPAGLTINEVAEKLGVDRKTISRIVNGHAGITAEMAVLLSKAFNTSPALWLNMQSAYDLWKAERQLEKRAAKIKPFDSRVEARR